MAKAALTMVAFLAVFAVLVLVAGSIPPQKQVEAAKTSGSPVVARGQVIEPVVVERRGSGAESAPLRTSK